MLEYQLLSPEDEVEEIYPYRRVWRALITEMVLLLIVVGGVIGAIRFGVVEDTQAPELAVLVALVPLGAFYWMSVRREQDVLQPRKGLLLVLVLSLIVGNGVAWPIIEFVFTPDDWLPESGFFSRIIGYALTLGVLAEFAKYVVVRYTVWPERFRTRLDGIAYSIPAALGYATVINLHFVLNEDPTLSAAVIRIITNVYMHISIGAIVGYFLAELAIGGAPAFWLPMGLVIAAFLSGIYIAFRRIATVSGLSSRDVGGALAIAGFTIVVLGALSFLIESADARMASRARVRRIR